MRAAAPRWGPLPWFVLVLTGLVVLLVVILPPFVLDESAPPSWVERRALRVASWHGDSDPVEAVWLKMSWEEAAEVMAKAEAARYGATAGPSPLPTDDGGAATPSPQASGLQPSASPPFASPSADASPSPSASPTKLSRKEARKAVTDPGRTMYLVALRGRFEAAPHGQLSPATAPERWLVVVFDSVELDRWQVGVFEHRPVLPKKETRIFPLE